LDPAPAAEAGCGRRLQEWRSAASNSVCRGGKVSTIPDLPARSLSCASRVPPRPGRRLRPQPRSPV